MRFNLSDYESLIVSGFFRKTEGPYVICIDGFMGTGKSTGSRSFFKSFNKSPSVKIVELDHFLQSCNPADHYTQILTDLRDYIPLNYFSNFKCDFLIVEGLFSFKLLQNIDFHIDLSFFLTKSTILTSECFREITNLNPVSKKLKLVLSERAGGLRENQINYFHDEALHTKVDIVANVFVVSRNWLLFRYINIFIYR